MSIKVEGFKQLEQDLEKRFGRKVMQRVVDRALQKGAKKIVAELKTQFQDFKDTGQSMREITISKPMTINGKRTIRVHWKGPKDRYRVIHLNEFGTIKNPNPKGKGAVERALRNGRKAYFEEVERYIRKVGGR